ncbi:MAG: N-succinylarginine dihydrolase [Planctomycetota bacterium]|jgi:succinylarginine dihydrolase
MTERWVEIQIDGIIGPTHHFGGLGVGNVASQRSQWRTSHPRSAALEGLAKMERVASLGVPQFFLPPLVRPDWQVLEQHGYRGERSDILKRCGDENPQLLSAAYSSSFMWTANAATTASGVDTRDGRSHAVIANLSASLHRSIESRARWQQFKVWTAGVEGIEIHEPLGAESALRDEGAANHMRLCHSSGNLSGLHLFVHEPTDGYEQKDAPKFRSRQGQRASERVAEMLQLPFGRRLFLEQTQLAIDAGVFHNDVIATSHRNLLLCHEDALVDQQQSLTRIRDAFSKGTGETLHVIEVPRSKLPLEEAVRTYLFNSQIVTGSDERMHLICPSQCAESEATRSLIDAWIADPSNPIRDVAYVPLTESMANGGGPACLRLRWTLPKSVLDGPMSVWRWTPEWAEKLRAWIDRYYVDQLQFAEFQSLEFAEQAIAAVAAFPGSLRT